MINDFECLVYAIPYLEKHQFKYIQKGKDSSKNRLNHKNFAIIGAGTGLGCARGWINIDKIQSFSSEGGHIEFAPRCDKEWELTQWLKNDLNVKRLSIERVISGNHRRKNEDGTTTLLSGGESDFFYQSAFHELFRFDMQYLILQHV